MYGGGFGLFFARRSFFLMAFYSTGGRTGMTMGGTPAGGMYGGAAGMGGGAAGMYGGGAGVAAARRPNGICCAVGVGEEATVCGVGCGGAGQGALSFVGTGQGEYIQETTYKYVGCGGDFD